MKLMKNIYLTFLHALAFLLLEVAGQPPSSTLSPTINGPRSPAGRDDHSHNRHESTGTITKLPTTPSPSKFPSVPPVAKPTPNPRRVPTTKNKRHRGPTDSPIAPPPPCPYTSCSDEASFRFTSATPQTGTFDATCVSSSAGASINQCGIINANVKANFFQLYFNTNYVATVSISDATFTPSIFVFGQPFNNEVCIGTLCPPLQGGFSQGDSSVSWVTFQDYYDVLIVADTGTPSTFTLNIDCNPL